MDPDTRPIKAQVGTNKEASAGALGVLPILSQQEKDDKPHQLLQHNYHINGQKYILLEILS